MLSPEDNERLTRVGAGTPMGEVLRRYWLPAALSGELSVADGAPVRVRLLGDEAVEIGNYRVTCVAAVPQAPIVSPFATAGDRDAAKIGERITYPGGVRTPTSLYDRTQLPPGAEVAGPAILLQADTTVLVLAGQTATVVDLGVLPTVVPPEAIWERAKVDL